MARSPGVCRTSRRQALTALAFLVLAPWTGAAAPEEVDPERSLEVQVKAEFIERFTRFVDWPAGAFPRGDSPFVVCAVGAGALSARLGEVLARGRPGGHPVQLRRVGPDGALDGCHLLYVSAAGRDRVEDVLRHIRGKPVLSVGDTPGFAERGIAINLYVDESSFVRFEINRGAAAASGLRFSARLMSLARLVTTRE